MEFFNCGEVRSFGFCKNGIMSINIFKTLKRLGEEKLIRKLNKLNEKNQLFSFTNILGVGNLTLYTLLNTGPVMVNLVDEKSRFFHNVSSADLQKFKLIEDFGIVVDLGGLSNEYIVNALGKVSKNFALSGALLSGQVSAKALTFDIENLLVRKNALFIIKLTERNCKLEAGLISRFVKMYGVNNVALSLRRTRVTLLKKLKKELLKEGVLDEQVKQIFYSNAKNFFALSLLKHRINKEERAEGLEVINL